MNKPKLANDTFITILFYFNQSVTPSSQKVRIRRLSCFSNCILRTSTLSSICAYIRLLATTMGTMFNCLFTKNANQLKLTAADECVQALWHAKDDLLTLKENISLREESQLEWLWMVNWFTELVFTPKLSLDFPELWTSSEKNGKQQYEEKMPWLTSSSGNKSVIIS